MSRWKAILPVIILTGLVSHAETFTISAVSGSWSNVVGAGGTLSILLEVPVLYGNGLEDQIRWGISTGGGQSGLGFTGVAPPPRPFALDESFEIGQLRHFNETIYQPWATAADLAIHLTFSDPAGVLKNFAFTFQINETFNLTGHSPADDDFIYFPSSFAEEVFEFRGISGTLELLGFGTTAGNLVPQFQSAEGTDNAARLWGRITAPVQVPAPGAVLLGALGLAIAAGRLRRPAA